MFSYQNKKYSIRKVKNGVASVVIALLFSLGGVSKVHAIEQNCGSEDWSSSLQQKCEHGEGELKFEFEKDGGEGSRFHDHLGSRGRTPELPGLEGERENDGLHGRTPELPGLEGERSPHPEDLPLGYGYPKAEIESLHGKSPRPEDGEYGPHPEEGERKNDGLSGRTPELPGLEGERENDGLSGRTPALPGLSGEREGDIIGLHGRTPELPGLEGERENDGLSGRTPGLPGLSGEREGDIIGLHGRTPELPGLEGERSPHPEDLPLGHGYPKAEIESLHGKSPRPEDGEYGPHPEEGERENDGLSGRTPELPGLSGEREGDIIGLHGRTPELPGLEGERENDGLSGRTPELPGCE
ncbi:YSIRK-type signal peptide-containing protein [Streptococcus sp. S784/96/1]|uniref:YSIRK-type signal peptide-containing protein n=1 Tax=Streptococcus sp. S784/96/1 TaxID=2653499 RepID=UPI00138A3E40|nr:YSIRK-type signal peptide-containing protein [Streptococcus sp. S784/96/1]